MRYLLVLFLFVGHCFGAEYFVSTTGNDSTGDGSMGTPWRTITNGVEQMSGGDRLTIRGGTYSENLPNTIPAGTGWNAATTIQAYTGETVVMDPTPADASDIIRFTTPASQYVILSGLTLDGSKLTNGGNCLKITYTTPGEPAHHIKVTNCIIKNAYDGMCVLLTSSADYVPTHCEFLNCTVYGAGWIRDSTPNKYGFYVSTSSNVFDGCTVYSNLNLGFHFFNGRPSNNTVKNCRFTTTPGTDAIGLYGGTNNAFYNNTFEGYNVGILVNPSDATDDTFILNNSFRSNGVAIIVQNSGALAGDTTVENNVISGQQNGSYGAIQFGTGVSTQSTIIAQNNVIAGDGLLGQINDIAEGATVSGNLTNQSSVGFLSDFRLASDSPAIGVGLVQSLFSTDAAGVSRGSVWDAGAFEYEAERLLNIGILRAQNLILR